MTTAQRLRAIYSTRGETGFDAASWGVMFAVAFVCSAPFWLAVVVVGMARGWW